MLGDDNYGSHGKLKWREKLRCVAGKVTMHSRIKNDELQQISRIDDVHHLYSVCGTSQSHVTQTGSQHFCSTC